MPKDIKPKLILDYDEIAFHCIYCKALLIQKLQMYALGDYPLVSWKEKCPECWKNI